MKFIVRGSPPTFVAFVHYLCTDFAKNAHKMCLFFILYRYTATIIDLLYNFRQRHTARAITTPIQCRDKDESDLVSLKVAHSPLFYTNFDVPTNTDDDSTTKYPQ